MSVVAVIVGDSFIHSILWGFLLELSAMLLVMFTFFRSGLRDLRRKWKEFLCSSAYGRQLGCRTETLRTGIF